MLTFVTADANEIDALTKNWSTLKRILSAEITAAYVDRSDAKRPAHGTASMCFWFLLLLPKKSNITNRF